jgi:hypothetical protein
MSKGVRGRNLVQGNQGEEMNRRAKIFLPVLLVWLAAAFVYSFIHHGQMRPPKEGRRWSLGFPENLLRITVGHSGISITDLYDRSTEDEPFRKEWCAKMGLGFELPQLAASSTPAS